MISAKVIREMPTHTQLAHEQIIEHAVNGDIPIGWTVSTLEIANMLDMSRTPVREALLIHAQDNIVSFRPNQGAVIEAVEAGAVEEALKTRYWIENGLLQEVGRQAFTDLQAPGMEKAPTQDLAIQADTTLHTEIFHRGKVHGFDRFLAVSGIKRRLFHAQNPLSEEGVTTLNDSNRELVAALTSSMSSEQVQAVRTQSYAAQRLLLSRAA